MRTRILLFISLAGVLVLSPRGSAQPQASPDEQALWKLEHSYWERVEQNDLTAYRALWDEDFLGWPSMSAAPVHKDHITDWITSQTSKGLAFKTVGFRPAAMHVHGDVAVTYYWITDKWVNKDGKGAATYQPHHAYLAQEREGLAHHRRDVDGGGWRFAEVGSSKSAKAGKELRLGEDSPGTLVGQFFVAFNHCSTRHLLRRLDERNLCFGCQTCRHYDSRNQAT